MRKQQHFAKRGFNSTEKIFCRKIILFRPRAEPTDATQACCKRIPWGLELPAAGKFL